MQNRNYLYANDIYLRLAIGNAPWPIGVTSVGIHERASREKISHVMNVHGQAHIMNDEATRKFLQVGRTGGAGVCVRKEGGCLSERWGARAMHDHAAPAPFPTCLRARCRATSVCVCVCVSCGVRVSAGSQTEAGSHLIALGPFCVPTL